MTCFFKKKFPTKQTKQGFNISSTVVCPPNQSVNTSELVI